MTKKEYIIKVEKYGRVYEIYANGIFVRTIKDMRTLVSYFEWLYNANPMKELIIDAGYILPEIIKYQEKTACQTSNY